ncbi:MAG: hypothetical protein HC893_10045, partial [Chloroflexaceae bacterium]|nr:hypothetical protein [Chloroflexaceae bacterium]
MRCKSFHRIVEARSAVAVALYQTGRYQQALQLLGEMRTADSENPFYIEYVARTQERMGDTDAAIATYNSLIGLHQQRRAVAKTIEVQREILRLRPELDEAREQMARSMAEA